MKNVIKKRGVSTVVATVLIILLTITVAGLVAQVIIPYVRENLAKSTECFAYKDYFQFEQSLEYQGQTKKYNCYQSQGALVGSSIKAVTKGNISENLKGFNITFRNSGSSEIAGISNGVTTTKGINGVWIFNSSEALQVPKEGEVITYVYKSIQNKPYEIAEVYPVLKSGRICPMSSSIKILLCDGVNLSQ